VKKTKSWLLIWLIYLLIVLAFLIIHLKNPFYADDYWPLAFARLTENPFAGLWGPFWGKSFWRPLPILMDVLSERWFGLNPLGWHLLDLFLGSFNLLLVSYLVYLLSGDNDERARKIFAISAGLIFALHPISLITTAWISCRADLLSVFFGLCSLILVLLGLNSRRLGFLKIFLALALSFAAYLSKDSAMILPGFVLLVIIFQPNQKPWWKKLIEATILLFLFLLVFAIYLWLRRHQTGFIIGGYEPLEFSASFLIPRLKFHLPLVLSKAFQDYFFWNLHNGFWFWLIASSYILLALAFLVGFVRSKRPALLGLSWLLLSLMPLWNLSHMLFFRQERLLYFGLIGWAMIFAGIGYSARSKILRGIILMALLIIAVSFGKASFTELKNFQKHCREYDTVREKVFRAIGDENVPSFARRIYVFGLGFDFYYLDPMFKVYQPNWLNRIVIPADIPSLAWVKKETALEYAEKRQFLPEIEIHLSDKKTSVLSVKPPDDIPLAVTHDQQATALEWKSGRMESITAELIRLFQDRRFLQENHQQKLFLFPSYEFRKRNYPLDWKLSPGLELRTPAHLAELYTFYSKTDDPYLVSPPLNFLALATSELELKMRIQKKDYLAPQEREGCIFWTTINDKNEFGWQAQQKICFKIYADSEFHIYHIPLDHNLYWLRSFKITRVRLDPISFPGWFQIDYLLFSPSSSKTD